MVATASHASAQSAATVTVAIALLLLSASCHGHSCPAGTTMRGGPPPRSQAQWCEGGSKLMEQVPHPRRSYESALNMGRPTAVPDRQIEGPVTTWYADGTPESHGSYRSLADGRSVPDGMWTFWHPSGQPHTQGVYEGGEPVGCFTIWNEAGHASTATPVNGELVESPCPAADPGPIAVLSEELKPARHTDKGDISVQTFLSPSGYGLRYVSEPSTTPVLRENLQFAVRRYWGPVRLGAATALRGSDRDDHWGVTFAGLAALRLPSPHEDLDFEIGTELGAQRLEADRTLPLALTTHREHTFWAPFAALQLSGAYRLHRSIAVVLAGRVDGAPTRDEVRETRYCTLSGCSFTYEEDIEVGGFAYGAVLGFRLLL